MSFIIYKFILYNITLLLYRYYLTFESLTYKRKLLELRILKQFIIKKCNFFTTISFLYNFSFKLASFNSLSAISLMLSSFSYKSSFKSLISFWHVLNSVIDWTKGVSSEYSLFNLIDLFVSKLSFVQTSYANNFFVHTNLAQTNLSYTQIWLKRNEKHQKLINVPKFSKI